MSNHTPSATKPSGRSPSVIRGGLYPRLGERQNLSRARRGIRASSAEIGEGASGRGPRASILVQTQSPKGRAGLPLALWERQSLPRT